MDEGAGRSDLEKCGATWVIVLAGGEGSRLRALTTTPSGMAVPKQFCSLRDGPSLLNETLQRAASVAADAHICAVVARQHARWWRRQLESLPRENVIVQPQSRGTALGILLPLVSILDRDPRALVVVLPSDHHVAEEVVLREALASAVNVVRENRAKILLLGVAPEAADPELGYIVPARLGVDVSPIERFVEKPSVPEARFLIERGALWNIFVLVARASALAALLTRHDPMLRERIRVARREGGSAIAELYRRLPNIDFSYQVARGNEGLLSLLRVPPCGWTDLGTVERLQKTLTRSGERIPDGFSVFRRKGRLSLQRQHTEWQRLSREGPALAKHA